MHIKITNGTPEIYTIEQLRQDIADAAQTEDITQVVMAEATDPETGEPVMVKETRVVGSRKRKVSVPKASAFTTADLAGYDMYPVTVADKPIPAAGEVAERDALPTLQGGEWVLGWTVRAETAQELADAKMRRHAELAAIRWAAETGGLTFGGAPVATDDRSKALIYGASGRDVPHFKVAPGTFISLTAAETTALAEAVAAHVQACFDNEASLASQIEAATTIAAVEAVDLDTGWPA